MPSGIAVVQNGTIINAGPPSANLIDQWLASLGTWQDSGKTTPASANNDPVGAWVSQAGNLNEVLQATSGKRPLLQTNAINSLPAILFDGSDDALDCASYGGTAIASSFTLFFVIKMWTQTGGTGSFRRFSIGSSSNPCQLYGQNLNSVTPKISAQFAANGANFVDQAWCIYRCSFTANSGQTRLNAGTETGGNVGTLGTRTTVTFAGDHAMADSFGHIAIAEALFYNTVLGTTDEAAVRDYLNAKYAIF